MKQPVSISESRHWLVVDNEEPPWIEHSDCPTRVVGEGPHSYVEHSCDVSQLEDEVGLEILGIEGVPRHSVTGTPLAPGRYAVTLSQESWRNSYGGVEYSYSLRIVEPESAAERSSVTTGPRGGRVLDCTCGTRTSWPFSRPSVMCRGCGARWH